MIPTFRCAAIAGCALLAWASPARASDHALDAPSRVHIRQEIAVRWTAPQPGGLLEIRGAAGAGARASYAYARATPQAILAPEAPGEYVLVFVDGGEVRASRALTVFMPEASLEVPPTVDAGTQFAVGWRGPESRQDQVAIARRDGAPIRGASYAYVGNAKDGRLQLRAPMDPGEYDVVYVSGSTVLARAALAVGAVSATLAHAPRVHAGGMLRVVWEGPRNDQDLVSFAARDGEPLRGGSYAYVGQSTDHAVALRAPERAGPLDVVYLSGGRVIGRSPVDVVEARVSLDAADEVTALEAFTATWQGDGNHGDWIGVVDEAGDKLAYDYVRPDAGEVRLVAPAAAGSWHLVYTTREGREMARRLIRVLPAAEPPGTLVVEQAGSLLGRDDAVGVVFDASGSMLQRLDGRRRVEIARQTLAALVDTVIPAGTGFALRVFGHREAGSCRSDLEIPLGPLDPARAGAAIRAIEATNLARTPLGRSIELAGSDLGAASGQRLLVVLTDGEETCDGDPAAAIEALRQRGWDISVNIVGFAIDDDALEAEFAAWAALGGGAYFPAADAAALQAALQQATVRRFEVLDGGGAAVADGRPGEPITLPAGDYLVRWGADRTTPVTVRPGEHAQVVLQRD